MRRLYIPGVALLAFGYPLSMVWFLQLGIASSELNLAVKGITALLFAVSLMGSILLGRRAPIGLAPIFIFLFLYGIRLIYDVRVEGIVPPFATPAYVLLYFFALTLLPALAIGFAFKPSDVPILHRWLFWTLVLVNASLIFYVFTSGYGAGGAALQGRFEVLGEEESTTVINPIVVSLMGAALSLFVLGRLAVVGRISFPVQMVHLGFFGLGVLNLLMGGSRGPVVGFAVGVLVVTASVIYAARSRRLQLHVQPRLFVYLAAMFTGLVVLATRDGVSFTVFDRFRSMFEPGGRVLEERDFVYAAAWQDFLNSPILGHSYLTMGGLALPHNVPLEALASLGVIGGVGAAFCIWLTLRGTWNGALVRYGPFGYSLALLAACFLMLTMTSGSISQSPELWVICLLVMCMAGRPSVANRPTEQKFSAA